MPQIQGRTTVAATSVSTNVLAGRLFERVGGRGAAIKVYAATEGALGDMTGSMITGSDVMFQDSPLSVNATGLAVPDDQIGSGIALPGDQLTLTLGNLNAAARVANWLVDIENA